MVDLSSIEDQLLKCQEKITEIKKLLGSIFSNLGQESKDNDEWVELNDELFTDQEREKLHAINTTRQCAMFNLIGLEKQRREIIARVRARQAGGGSGDETR